MPVRVGSSERPGLTGWVGNARRLLGSQLALHMAGKAVQDGLPAGTLLLLGMSCLSIEGDGHGDALDAIRELNDSHSVAEGVFDQLMRDHLCVLALEVESEGAILGFHPRGELPTWPKVD